MKEHPASEGLKQMVRRRLCSAALHRASLRYGGASEQSHDRSVFVENCVADIRPGTLNYVPWDEVAPRVTIPAFHPSGRAS